MTYHELFRYIKEKLIDTDVSSFDYDVAYQFNVRGKGEGAFYAEIKNNVLSIEPYEYYDRNVIFECDSQILVDIADGKLDPTDAIISGTLRFEGDKSKAMEFKKIFDEITKPAETPAPAPEKSEPEQKTEKAEPEKVADAPVAETKSEPAAQPVKKAAPAAAKKTGKKSSKKRK